MANEQVGQPVVVPPDMPWQVNTVKLSDGTFLMEVQTVNAGIRIHLTREDLKRIAADMFQQTSGIHVATTNGKAHPEAN